MYKNGFNNTIKSKYNVLECKCFYRVSRVYRKWSNGSTIVEYVSTLSLVLDL